MWYFPVVHFTSLWITPNTLIVIVTPLKYCNMYVKPLLFLEGLVLSLVWKQTNKQKQMVVIYRKTNKRGEKFHLRLKHNFQVSQRRNELSR